MNENRSRTLPRHNFEDCERLREAKDMVLGKRYLSACFMRLAEFGPEYQKQALSLMSLFTENECAELPRGQKGAEPGS